jgi:hypothetical protein
MDRTRAAEEGIPKSGDKSGKVPGPIVEVLHLNVHWGLVFGSAVKIRLDTFKRPDKGMEIALGRKSLNPAKSICPEKPVHSGHKNVVF